MRNKILLRITGLLAAASLLVVMMSGCSVKAEENRNDERLSSDNIIITETGEVLEKEELTPTETEAPQEERNLRRYRRLSRQMSRNLRQPRFPRILLLI